MKKFFAIMAALALVVAFSGAALAAEQPGNTVSMSARILVDTGYYHLNKEATNNGDDDITKFFLNVPGHSYLRAEFTSADKTTGGRVEIGVGSNSGSTEISARHVYGWWKVGNCKLLAGNTNPPFGNRAGAPANVLGGDSAAADETGLEGRGYGYTGRVPQVSLTWESGAFAAELALVEPSRASKFGALYTGQSVDAYSYLPRADLNIRFSAGGFLVSPTVMVVNYQVEGAASNYDDNVTAWAVELPVVFKMAGFEVGAQIWYAMNNNGEICCVNAAPEIGSDGKLKDGSQVGGYLYVTYTMGAFSPSVGVGAINVENDNWSSSNGYQDDNYTKWGAYVSLKYAVTDTFTVYPEFTYFANGDDPRTGDDNGDAWIVGLQFRFMF